jgi:DNA repair protein RecN (Recombination protein N)
MLTQLQIRDFAIVDEVELGLEPGFTALTGETGAGKSILIDALLLAVGARADSGTVRHGAERAEVAASFDIRGNAAATSWLEDQAIEHDGECILRRVVSADGRSRAYVNGRAVAAQSLRELGSLLVDVHGQLEFQSLAKRAYQRALLDEFGSLADKTAAVRAAYRNWRDLKGSRDALEEQARDRDARLDLLSHYVSELEALDPKEGESARLEDERRRIAGLGRLAEGTSQLEFLLADEGAAGALARAQTVLRQLSTLDPALQATEVLVDEASIACTEALSNLQRYADTLEADPGRQEWVESRLAALESVARKHRVELEELPARLVQLGEDRDQLQNTATSLAELDKNLATAAREYERVAASLSVARNRTAGELDKQVSALMQHLGMPGGRVITRVDQHDPVEFADYGNDQVEFLVAANPGQPPRPLAKVASGGELSRISLAMQVITKNAAHLPCLVFDEVDTGVGGAVAEMVGRQLRTLADSGQVLSVTHLPQVAAQANHQVRVSKHSDKHSTRTSLQRLDDEARVNEIARMLGGARITDRTREHAREMLGSARAVTPLRRRATSASGAGSSPARSGRAK